MVYVDSKLPGKRYMKGCKVFMYTYMHLCTCEFAGLEDCKTQENETQKKSCFLCNFSLQVFNSYVVNIY